AVLIPFLWGGSGGIASAAGSAGQSVANQASASLGISSGGAGGTLSNLASLAVLPVSGILVSPDDLVVSAFIAPDPAIVRRFLVTNQGNRDDRFRITAASVSPPALLTGIFLDLDGNGAIDPADPPVSLGTTASPLLPPGGSLGVLVRFSPAGRSRGPPVVRGCPAGSLEPGAVNGLSTDL